MKNKNQYTAKNILEIISKPYCTTSDLMILTHSGKNTCLKIKKQLREQLESENYFLPKSVLPMDKVVEFLKINISYLKKVGSSNEIAQTKRKEDCLCQQENSE